MSKNPTHHRVIPIGNLEIPVHRCSSCQAEILWATTPNDKAMCLDVEPNPDGTWITKLRAKEGGGVRILCSYKKVGEPTAPGEKRRTSHWSTCPNADKHRSNQ